MSTSGRRARIVSPPPSGPSHRVTPIGVWPDVSPRPAPDTAAQGEDRQWAAGCFARATICVGLTKRKATISQTRVSAM